MSILLSKNKTYENQTIKLIEILDNIVNKKYAIPIMQRDFRWKDNDVKKLGVSLLSGYNIGQFLLFEGDKESFGIKDNSSNYFIKSNTSENKITYIIDGQQRLTSISELFFKKNKNSNNYEYCIDMYSLISNIFDYHQEEFPNLIVKNKPLSLRYLSFNYVLNLYKNSSKIDIPSFWSSYVQILKSKLQDDPETFAELKKNTAENFLEQNEISIHDNKPEILHLIESDFLMKDNCFSKYFNISIFDLFEYEMSIKLFNVFKFMFETTFNINYLQNCDYKFVEENFNLFNNSGKKLSALDLINSKTYNKTTKKTFVSIVTEDLLQEVKNDKTLTKILKNFLNYDEQKRCFADDGLANLLKVLHLTEFFDDKKANNEVLTHSILSERNNISSRKPTLYISLWEKYKKDIVSIFKWITEEKLSFIPSIHLLFAISYILHFSKNEGVIEELFLFKKDKYSQCLIDGFIKCLVIISYKGIGLDKQQAETLLKFYYAINDFLKLIKSKEHINNIHYFKIPDFHVSPLTVNNIFQVTNFNKNSIGRLFLYFIQKPDGDFKMLKYDIANNLINLDDLSDFDLHHIIPKSIVANEESLKQKAKSLANIRLLHCNDNQKVVSNHLHKSYFEAFKVKFPSVKDFNKVLEENFLPSYEEIQELSAEEFLNKSAQLICNAFNSTYLFKK